MPAVPVAAGRWLAAAFLVFVPADAQATAPEPDPGQQAYATGRYVEARQRWMPRAENGDADAQLGLGSLYDLGQGVARDPVAAYRWYRRAAEAGLAAAEFNVAVMRDTGDGVVRDPAKAALWYARAAAHGNRRAQYNLGQLYTAGDGVPRNPAQADAWFRDAAISLSAARDRLAAIGRNGIPDSPAAGIRAAQPTAPADGATVPALVGAPGTTAMVELVWTAPAQARRVRFFVQVLSVDATTPHEVLATYLDETAILAPVAPMPGRYLWRVYAVGRNPNQYAASGWSRFQVGPLR